MNCTDFGQLLSAYIDGALEASQQAALQAHLQSCAHCRQEDQQLRQMVQDLRTLPKPQAPELLAGIHRRLNPAPWWQGFVAPWPASLPWHGLALATTALLVLLVARPRPFDGVSQPQLLAKAELSPSSVIARERFELESDAKDKGRLKSSDEEAPLESQSSDDFDKRLRLAASVPQKEKLIEEGDRPSAVILPVPERQLGASVELASAGAGGFVNEGKDAGRSFGGAMGDYRIAALPRGNLRQSAFPESASVLGVEGQILDQLVNGLAQGQGTQKLIAAKKTSQSRADISSFGGPQSFSNGKPVLSNAGLLQLRLLVTQVDEAVSQITVWANDHDGFVTLTTPNHLSVMLPASEVGTFLQAFSSEVLAQPDIDDSASWVTLSLELVPSQ